MEVKASIGVIDAICGSGKSHGMKEYIARWWDRQKFIVAVPTIELQKQTARDLRKQDVSRVNVITSEDGVNVGEVLAQSLLPSSPYRVLIVTHQALLNLGKRILMNEGAGKYLNDFIVFCDEVPNALFSTSVDVGVEANNTDWLRSVDNTNQDMMFGNDMKGLDSFYRERDNGTEDLKDLIWMLSAGYPGYKRNNKGNGYTVIAYAHSPIIEVVKHSPKFYLMGANASRSPFVYVAENWCGIQITEPHHRLKVEDKRNEHLNQERVTVHAILKERGSLQKIIESKHNNSPEYPEFEVPMFDEICRQAALILRNDFLFTTNKDRKGCSFEEISDRRYKGRGARVPFTSHGMNIYGGHEIHGISEHSLERDYKVNDVELYTRGFNKAAWLAVARLSQEAKGYLKKLCEMKGGDGDRLVELCENFMMGEAAYQMMLRTKLRNPKDTSQVELVFIDEYTMRYFVENYYPKAKIGSIGLVEFKKMEGKGSKTRAVVQQWKKQGLTQKEVAAITGKGLRTVERHWASSDKEETEEVTELEELPF